MDGLPMEHSLNMEDGGYPFMCGGFLKWGYPKPPLVSILKWSSMTWMIWGTPILGTPHINRVYYVLILWCYAGVIYCDTVSVYLSCKEWRCHEFLGKEDGWSCKHRQGLKEVVMEDGPGPGHFTLHAPRRGKPCSPRSETLEPLDDQLRRSQLRCGGILKKGGAHVGGSR